MYRRNLQGWSKHLDFMILDMISLQAAFILAYMIRFGCVGWFNPYVDRIYRNMAVVIALIDIIVVVFFESMKDVLTRISMYGKYRPMRFLLFFHREKVRD